jgi:hypothetical protein
MSPAAGGLRPAILDVDLQSSEVGAGISGTRGEGRSKLRLTVVVGVMCLPVLLLVSCGVGEPTGGSPTPESQAAVADTFLSGCAYVDRDGDGELDVGERLIGGLSYSFTLEGGVGFGAESGDGECGFVTVPAALPPEAWPIVVRVEVEEPYANTPGASTVIALEWPATRADFPFAPQ